MLGAEFTHIRHLICDNLPKIYHTAPVVNRCFFKLCLFVCFGFWCFFGGGGVGGWGLWTFCAYPILHLDWGPISGTFNSVAYSIFIPSRSRAYIPHIMTPNIYILGYAQFVYWKCDGFVMSCGRMSITTRQMQGVYERISYSALQLEVICLTAESPTLCA